MDARMERDDEAQAITRELDARRGERKPLTAEKEGSPTAVAGS
jgi:hypothetical protein